MKPEVALFILVLAFYTNPGHAQLPGSNVRNIGRTGFIFNINVVGNGNTVTATIPVEQINKSIRSAISVLAKTQSARMDKMYAQLKEIAEKLDNIKDPGKLMDYQSAASEILSTLTEKHLSNSPDQEEVSREVFSTYKTIQPLLSHRDKVVITEIDGVKYYLTDNIPYNSDDLTVYKENKALIRFKFKNKYGYLNKAGVIVKSAQYDSAAEMNDQYALVYTAGLYWAFIDSTGNVVKKFNTDEFESVHSFSDHIALVKRRVSGNKPGYSFLNTRWQTVGGPFLFAGDYSFGLACVGQEVQDTFLLHYLDSHPNGMNSHIAYYIAALELADPNYARRIEDACTQYIHLKEEGLAKKAPDSCLSILCSRPFFQYRDTNGITRISDTTLIAEPFDYFNTARVCQLSTKTGDFDINFHLISRQGKIKGETVFYPTLITREPRFPISAFRDGLAIAGDQIIDSSGEALYQLEPGRQFSDNYRDGLFVVLRNEEALSAAGNKDTGHFNCTPYSYHHYLDYSLTSYGLINKFGVEALPASYKNIELVQSYFYRALGFDNKVFFFNVSPNGKSVLAKTTPI